MAAYFPMPQRLLRVHRRSDRRVAIGSPAGLVLSLLFLAAGTGSALQRLPDTALNGGYYRFSSDEYAGNVEALQARFDMPLPPSRSSALASPIRSDL